MVKYEYIISATLHIAGSVEYMLQDKVRCNFNPRISGMDVYPDSLESAKRWCNKDPKCAMIYVWKSLHKDVYFYCPEGELLIRESWIYKEQVYVKNMQGIRTCSVCMKYTGKKLDISMIGMHL